MQVRAKYVAEFTIKNGKIRSSRIIGEEHATLEQKKAIAVAKPLLNAFVKSRLTDEVQFENCIVAVRVNYIETARGLEIVFKA